MQRNLERTGGVKMTDFEKIYNLLMDYWEYIPEQDRQKLHKELEEILANRKVRKAGSLVVFRPPFFY